MEQNLAEPKPISETAPILAVGVDNEVFANLAGTLSEIRKLKGVLGYILRSNTSAIIDLTEQEKIIEYAILSTQIYESSQQICKDFKVDEIESVLVEYGSIKVLCMFLGENMVSVFIDKSATHEWIMKRILI